MVCHRVHREQCRVLSKRFHKCVLILLELHAKKLQKRHKEEPPDFRSKQFGRATVNSFPFTCFTLAQRKDCKMVETRPVGSGLRLFGWVGLLLGFLCPFLHLMYFPSFNDDLEHAHTASVLVEKKMSS